jgi:hypothetical protein
VLENAQFVSNIVQAHFMGTTRAQQRRQASERLLKRQQVMAQREQAIAQREERLAQWQPVQLWTTLTGGVLARAKNPTKELPVHDCSV